MSAAQPTKLRAVHSRLPAVLDRPSLLAGRCSRSQSRVPKLRKSRSTRTRNRDMEAMGRRGVEACSTRGILRCRVHYNPPHLADAERHSDSRAGPIACPSAVIDKPPHGPNCTCHPAQAKCVAQLSTDPHPTVCYSGWRSAMKIVPTEALAQPLPQAQAVTRYRETQSPTDCDVGPPALCVASSEHMH